jgi:hypothetical protein
LTEKKNEQDGQRGANEPGSRTPPDDAIKQKLLKSREKPADPAQPPPAPGQGPATAP